MRDIKADFPIFTAHPELIYLDSAATTQKPRSVIQALSDFYSCDYASPHRGLYGLADEVTKRYEQVREQTALFIGAKDSSEVIFTQNTTEGINTIAYGWALYNLKAGDEIILSEAEHHANILPWQLIAELKGVVLKWIKVNPDGTIHADQALSLFNNRTKLLAITAYSNVLGPLDDLASEPEYRQKSFLAELTQHARHHNAKILIDAAQYAPNIPRVVSTVDCDFLAFSSHKILGPMGVGVLYIAKNVQKEMHPFHRGGGTVNSVDHTRAEWKSFPHLMEAGTRPVGDVVALGAALEYLEKNIDQHEAEKNNRALCTRLVDGLLQLPRVKIIQPYHFTSPNHLVSFIIEGMHPHDVSTFLNDRSICIRAGHHCASLTHKVLGLPQGSLRASFYVYSVPSDVDALLEALSHLLR